VKRPRAFTLVELLVCIAVIALLVGLLVPALAGARDSARTSACMSNQRQLAIGWTMYAQAHADRAMPLAYWEAADIGGGPQVFWWGTHGTASTPPDFSRGFLSPYLDTALAARSVLECPSQAWGTYRPQGPSKSITSTYGYNGYFLSPAKTPGWGAAIGFRPWQRVSNLTQPTELFVFADALLASGSPKALPGNTALLDPPMLYSGGAWTPNPFATTAFRHARQRSGPGSAVTARADISVRSTHMSTTRAADSLVFIGAADDVNDPHYIPDWRAW
jgi:prepilin-type N-terminal cleavage/methylation domain-containing protein